MLTKENLRRKNFSPDEFFVSDTAYRLNHDKDLTNDIVNYPSHEQSILPCLMSTADMAQELFDLLYAEFACIFTMEIKKEVFSVKINSGYRSEKLNKLIGGDRNSQHLQGLALDLVCPAFGSPEKIMKFLHSKGFLVDQCFCEGTWLHISRSLVKSQNRKMFGYYLPDKQGNRKFRSI